MNVAYRTHPGKLRDENQDTVLADEDLGLFIVADGMGGHQFGARASRMAVDRIQQHLAQQDRWTGEITDQVLAEQKRHLTDAFLIAHHAILDFARENAGGNIIGTTCTAVRMMHHRAVVCHIGDSGLYRYTNDALTRLTQEHTLVQELVDIGRLTPDQALESPYANILVRVLGVEEKCTPDTLDFALSAGDVLLICSDGLSKVADVQELEKILKEAHPTAIEQAADQMLDLALSRGGPDNISLILIHYAPSP